MSTETKTKEQEMLETAKKLAENVTTIRDTKGISTGEMEAVYSLGFNFYNTGRYDEAEKVFKFLVLFDHMTPKYWIGMGAIQQVRKNYDGAITSYGYASFLDLHDPKPQYLAAECFFAKGDKTNALSALEALKTFAPKDTERGRDYLAKAAELEARINAQETQPAA